MLTNIFESRNKTFLNLVKLGDYLGRSLRENVEIFSVDDGMVTYLTESGFVVTGKYDSKSVSLQGIEVEKSDIFENEDVFSEVTNKKVSSFLADLIESDIPKAKNSFDNILGLWETKLNFKRTQRRLQEKVENFNNTLNIVNSEEFQRVLEMKDSLIKLLKENEDFIVLPDIRNTIRLSSVISDAFNVPYLPIEELNESGSFSIPQELNTNLYEHLCKQELVAQELVESKASFDTIWITNERIQKLPSFIYESDDNIMGLVAEIISEVPYFAMASKKQLHSLIEGNLDLLVEDSQVPARDIKEFVAKIFEYKKPVKTYFTEVLNEKYGINIHNLTTVPTFKSLVEMESLIFECFAKLSPKSSNLKRVLMEFSQSLKEKNGVESIDVSDFLTGIFHECGYDSILNETTLLNYLDFSRIADDLGKVGQVLKMIQAGAMGGGQMDPSMGMGQPMNPNDGQMGMEDGGPLATGMTMDDVEGEEQGEIDQETETNPRAQMDPMQAAAETEMGGEGEEGIPEEGMEGEEGIPGEEGGSGDPIVDTLEQIKSLISDLEAEMGMGEEGMEGEEGIPEEGMEGMEGESEMGGEEGGPPMEDSGESEDGESDEAPPEEESEDKPKAKKKGNPFGK